MKVLHSLSTPTTYLVPLLVVVATSTRTAPAQVESVYCNFEICLCPWNGRTDWMTEWLTRSLACSLFAKYPRWRFFLLGIDRLSVFVHMISCTFATSIYKRNCNPNPNASSQSNETKSITIDSDRSRHKQSIESKRLTLRIHIINRLDCIHPHSLE
jgi:hypothetical protein